MSDAATPTNGTASPRGGRKWLMPVGIVAVAVIFGGLLLWNKLRTKPVSATLYQKTKVVVEKQPRLQPDWDAATADGVLTWTEAKAILDKAGEKAEPEE